MGRWWRYKWITFHPSLTLLGTCIQRALCQPYQPWSVNRG
ncbi:phage family integrase [Yersinia pestis biovar Antiqua str. UG05-0454]|nr:phage family integrase [Yersinia pestis biovar Antiqua str. UG05-0454]